MLCPPSAAVASGIEFEEQFPGDPRRNFTEKDLSICLKNAEEQPKYAGRRFFYLFHFPLSTELFLPLFLRFNSLHDLFPVPRAASPRGQVKTAFAAPGRRACLEEASKHGEE